MLASFILSAWLIMPGTVQAVSGDLLTIEASGNYYQVYADEIAAGSDVLLLVDSNGTTTPEDDKIRGIAKC